MTLEQAFRKAFHLDEQDDMMAPVINKYNYKHWLRRLEAELKPIQDLVESIDRVHECPEYQRVWRLANIEFGQYKGATYQKELEAVRQLLSARQEP
jgi:hypothetical protein